MTAAHDLKKRYLCKTKIIFFYIVLVFLILVLYCIMCVRMVGNSEVPSPALSVLQDSSRVTNEDDFLKITPRKTVEELKECTMVCDSCLDCAILFFVC